MKNNPKNNILMLKNKMQKRLTILEYFGDAYICYHYQHKNKRLIMMTNIYIEIFQNCYSFLSRNFGVSILRCCFSDYSSYYMFYNFQEEMVVRGFMFK